jgi:hypothetical protein
MPQAAAALGIEIERRGGALEITLPALAPKRKRRGSDFLFDPLYYALDKYAAVNTLPGFRECVICFTHIYNRELPSRRVRDYDNLELKCVLDVITAFTLTDDTGLLCNAYHSTELGDCDKTVVSVMEKNMLPNWLAEREKLTF